MDVRLSAPRESSSQSVFASLVLESGGSGSDSYFVHQSGTRKRVSKMTDGSRSSSSTPQVFLSDSLPPSEDHCNIDVQQDIDRHNAADTDALLGESSDDHSVTTGSPTASTNSTRQTHSSSHGRSSLLSSSSLFPLRSSIYSSSRPRILGITNPLTFRWFFSIHGAECCHLYFWVIKDLAWVQSWREFSIVAGVLALLWSLVLLYHGLRTLNWHEIWNFVASFLWLFANFWWMLGEAHDYEFPDAPPISIQHTYSSAKVLEVALMWSLVYYVIILPFDLLPCSQAALDEYDSGELPSRFSCFANFRQYENLHMLFWIAKDLAWNLVNLSLWLFCLVPAVLLALDFIYISVTTTTEDSTVDTVHFIAVFVWVIANSIWAYGDFFMADYSDPMEMWSSNNEEGGFRNARWYSSWALVCCLVPIVIMYFVWIFLTVTGQLKPPSDEEDQSRQQDSMVDWNPLQSETDVLLFGESGTGSGTSSSANAFATASVGKKSLLQMLSDGKSRANLVLQGRSAGDIHRSESSEGLLSRHIEEESTVSIPDRHSGQDSGSTRSTKREVEMIESASFRSRNRTITPSGIQQSAFHPSTDSLEAAAHAASSLDSSPSQTQSQTSSSQPVTANPLHWLFGSTQGQSLTRSKDSSDRLVQLAVPISSAATGLIVDERLPFDNSILQDNH